MNKHSEPRTMTHFALPLKTHPWRAEDCSAHRSSISYWSFDPALVKGEFCLEYTIDFGDLKEMNLQEYQKLTHQFAVYPEEKAIEYLVLGLISEINEYLCSVSRKEFVELELEIKKELSDCFWYLSELYNLIGVRFPTIEPIQGLSVASCLKTLAGDTKKYIRGDFDYNDYLHKLLISVEHLYIWCYTEVITWGVDLEEILQLNIDKLTSRKERGVIKGDGDDR